MEVSTPSALATHQLWINLADVSLIERLAIVAVYPSLRREDRVRDVARTLSRGRHSICAELIEPITVRGRWLLGFDDQIELGSFLEQRGSGVLPGSETEIGRAHV